MNTASSDRATQFKADVAAMKLSDSKPSSERTLLILGWVLIVAGIVLAIMAILTDNAASTVTTSEGPAQQRDAIVWAVAGVVFAVSGATLVIRYGLAKFLRFWMARLIFEQQSQTDRLLDK